MFNIPQLGAFGWKKFQSEFTWGRNTGRVQTLTSNLKDCENLRKN